MLIYGTGGMAFGEPKTAGDGKLRIGWTAGGGVEWAFAPKWSAKLEYLYTDIYRDLRKDVVDRHARFHTIRSRRELSFRSVLAAGAAVMTYGRG